MITHPSVDSKGAFGRLCEDAKNEFLSPLTIDNAGCAFFCIFEPELVLVLETKRNARNPIEYEYRLRLCTSTSTKIQELSSIEPEVLAHVAT